MPLSIEELASNANHPSYKDDELPTVISYPKHDGTCGFSFVDDHNCQPPGSIPASFYQRQDLQGLTLPPIGSTTKYLLPPLTPTLVQGRFVMVARSNRSDQLTYQPQLTTATTQSLKPLTMAAIVTEAGTDKTERLFAAGLKSRTDPAITLQDWKPDWVMLSEEMPVNSAKKALEAARRR
jgi:hypothetical protein